MGYIAPGAPGDPDPISRWYFPSMLIIWGIGLVVIPVAVMLIGSAILSR